MKGNLVLKTLAALTLVALVHTSVSAPLASEKRSDMAPMELNALLSKLDSRVYRPQDLGVKNLVASIKYPHLDRSLAAVSQTDINVIGRFVWEDGNLRSRFMGVPKNNQNFDEALNASLENQMDAFFARPLVEMWRGLNVKKTGEREFTAYPDKGELHKDIIEKFVLRYDDNFKVKQYESFAIDGRTVTEFEYDQVPGMDNKWRVQNSVVRIYGKGPEIRIENTFSYTKVADKYFFPERIITRRFLGDRLMETNQAVFSGHRVNL